MSKPILTALLVAAFAVPALAQQKADDHSAHHPAAAASVPADMASGEIRKVDRESKKITIKHGEIKNLDMPPMTMVFQVQDATLLDKVKAGDKVRFAAEKSAGGAYVVTDIRPAN
jgi:Cu(I)/Ag(I) efflux system periplasmic protein CusF